MGSHPGTEGLFLSGWFREQQELREMMGKRAGCQTTQSDRALVSGRDARQDAVHVLACQWR